MTSHFQIFDLIAKSPERRDRNDGCDNSAAAHNDLNVLFCFRGINPDSRGGFKWDHRVSRARIQRHFNIKRFNAVLDLGVAEDNAVLGVELKLAHQLKKLPRILWAVCLRNIQLIYGFYGGCSWRSGKFQPGAGCGRSSARKWVWWFPRWLCLRRPAAIAYGRVFSGLRCCAISLVY